MDMTINQYRKKQYFSFFWRKKRTAYDTRVS